MNFTRREKHVAVALCFIAFFIVLYHLVFSPAQIYHYASSVEYLYLLCVVAPLGFYVATDPQRLRKK